jgi:hypothetical protein
MKCKECIVVNLSSEAQNMSDTVEILAPNAVSKHDDIVKAIQQKSFALCGGVRPGKKSAAQEGLCVACQNYASGLMSAYDGLIDLLREEYVATAQFRVSQLNGLAKETE